MGVMKGNNGGKGIVTNKAGVKAKFPGVTDAPKSPKGMGKKRNIKG